MKFAATLFIAIASLVLDFGAASAQPGHIIDWCSATFKPPEAVRVSAFSIGKRSYPAAQFDSKRLPTKVWCFASQNLVPGPSQCFGLSLNEVLTECGALSWIRRTVSWNYFRTTLTLTIENQHNDQWRDFEIWAVY